MTCDMLHVTCDTCHITYGSPMLPSPPSFTPPHQAPTLAVCLPGPSLSSSAQCPLQSSLEWSCAAPPHPCHLKQTCVVRVGANVLLADMLLQCACVRACVTCCCRVLTIRPGEGRDLGSGSCGGGGNKEVEAISAGGKAVDPFDRCWLTCTCLPIPAASRALLLQLA